MESQEWVKQQKFKAEHFEYEEQAGSETDSQKTPNK